MLITGYADQVTGTPGFTATNIDPDDAGTVLAAAITAHPGLKVWNVQDEGDDDELESDDDDAEGETDDDE